MPCLLINMYIICTTTLPDNPSYCFLLCIWNKTLKYRCIVVIYIPSGIVIDNVSAENSFLVPFVSTRFSSLYTHETENVNIDILRRHFNRSQTFAGNNAWPCFILSRQLSAFYTDPYCPCPDSRGHKALYVSNAISCWMLICGIVYSDPVLQGLHLVYIIRPGIFQAWAWFQALESQISYI